MLDEEDAQKARSSVKKRLKEAILIKGEAEIGGCSVKERLRKGYAQ